MTVDEHDPLIVLRLDQQVERGGGVAENLIAELDQELTEITEQISLTQSVQARRAEGLTLQHRKSLEERRAYRAQLQAQVERTAITKEIFDRYDLLGKEDAAAFVEVEQWREAYTEQRQQVAVLEARIAQIDAQAHSLKAELDGLPDQTDQQLSELKMRAASLRQRKIEMEAKGKIVITAPIAGQVTAMSGTSGTVITGAAPLVSIMPEGSTLFATVYVPSRAIGFVTVGQDVRLMYQAYPHQRFGSAKGELVSVSRSILGPEELPPALGLEEPAYKARIALDAQDIEAFGQTFTLRPGMVLTAEIIQERRTFLQWILEPLRARRGDAA